MDVLAREPVPFEDLYTGSDLVAVDGTVIRVASRQHLIRMEAVGRPRDLQDVEHLRRLQQDGRL